MLSQGGIWLPCFKLLPKRNLSSLILELESTKVMKVSHMHTTHLFG